MLERAAARVASLVTRHDLAVIAVVTLLTAGVAAGIPQVAFEDGTDIDDDVFEQTEVGEALSYMDANYSDDDGPSLARSSVYVRPESGNALSRDWLVAALEYQASTLSDPAVERELAGEQVRGPPTLVGTHLAGENATLVEQRAAIANASDDELAAAIGATLGDSEVAAEFMPRSYDPGSTTAESFRVQFVFEQASVTQQQAPLPDEAAQQALYGTAQDRPAMFTMGAVAQAEWDEAQIQDVLWLIVPPALLLVLAVLAFAYRDLVDVVLGFVGVSVSLVWFFGILGWLGIPAGFASIVGPVLIVALSIDFGLHVFMRYREERGPGAGIREPMGRSMTSVMVAFLLVALTAGAGFLANVTSPIGFIRSFGVAITLGVLAAVAVFLTLVPALKVRVDGALERRGIDRRRTALGTAGRLRSALSAGVDLARYGAAAVVVAALVVGGTGVLAFAELDRQGFQQDFASTDDWQTELPDPVGWSAHETTYRQHLEYVEANYQADIDRDQSTALLVRGDVTRVAALERVRAGERAADDTPEAFSQGGTVRVRSPLSLVRTLAVESESVAAVVNGVAAENAAFGALVDALADDDEAFAAALASAPAADVDGEVTAVYDTLYEVAPGAATEVLERTDGEYRSMRLLVPVEQGLDVNEQGEAMRALADETAGDSDLTVTAVGFATVSNAGLGAVADSILETMLLAFAGIALLLGGLMRLERGRASLGVLTVVPIALVVGLVFGAMYLAGVPLTFVTAFLVSITIGLGIDYNIHIAERFAQERDRGRDPVDALYTTVRGTGGALLGSALTSGAAFATLLLHPSPVFQSFGLIVVGALLCSFAVSVLVFPSLLLWWVRGPRVVQAVRSAVPS